MTRFSKHIFSLFTTVLLLAVHVGAQAQQSSARAYLDNNSIEIGQQVKLTIEVKATGNNAPFKLTAPPDSLAPVEIISSEKTDTLRNNDTQVIRYNLLVTSFEPGKNTIPPFVLTRNTDTLRTAPIILTVSTVAVDTTKPFMPIKDITEVEEPSMFSQIVEHVKNNLPIYLAALLGIALAIFALWYFIKNKKPEQPGSKQPPEKPHERAQRLLKELAADQLWQQDRIKEYYSRLSDIIRNYLQERYGIQAPEQTTNELLAVTKNNRELRKVRAELKKILRTADLVKFAKANPVPEEHTACIDAAQEIIRRTMIKEEEANHD